MQRRLRILWVLSLFVAVGLPGHNKRQNTAIAQEALPEHGSEDIAPDPASVLTTEQYNRSGGYNRDRHHYSVYHCTLRMFQMGGQVLGRVLPAGRRDAAETSTSRWFVGSGIRDTYAREHPHHGDDDHGIDRGGSIDPRLSAVVPLGVEWIRDKRRGSLSPRSHFRTRD